MLASFFYILAAPFSFTPDAGNDLVVLQKQSSGPLLLHPNGDTNFCLDIQGGVFADGTPVQIFECNGTPAQKWVINEGNTKVRAFGTNFCLDAGSTPANGVGMKIWQCFNIPAQAWFYTPALDDRITLAGTGLCLDLTNGVHIDANPVQTWQCSTGNTNQIWTDELPPSILD